MAVCNVIKLSDVRSGFRIDSEFYKKEFIEKDLLLSKLRTTPLWRIAKITDGEHGSVSFVDTGIKYLTAEHIKQGFIDHSGARFVNAEVDQRNARARVKEGDVLVSIKGTLGEIGLAEKNLLPANMNRDVAIIKLYPDSPRGAYIAPFLRSKFGAFQLSREGSGGVQQMITLERLKSVLIPLLNKNIRNEIAAFHQKGLTIKQESDFIYTKAQLFLESALNLDKLSFKKPVGYTTRFSELDQSRRLDPEHFYPAFHNLIANLPGHMNIVPLGTQLSFCQRGKQPIYSKHGLPVVNSKQVQNNKVVLEGNRAATPNPISDLQIRHGDILMNGTGRGTLGRAAPYFDDGLAIPDNHVTILRSPALDPAFLSFFLNSPAGQLQVEMHQRSSSGQLELYPFDIRKFLVWVAPESFQKKIRSLYDQAAANEKRSKELLEQAKARAEQLIEEAVRQ